MHKDRPNTLLSWLLNVPIQFLHFLLDIQHRQVYLNDKNPAHLKEKNHKINNIFHAP